MEKDYRIGVLVHSNHVAEIVCEQTSCAGWDLPVKVTSYENALEDAHRLFAGGAEAVMCHGGFREAVFKEFGRRIIFIERSEIDLVRALARAKRLASTIALTAHVKEARDIEFMEQLLDITILPVRYDTPTELEEKITEAVKGGVTVFVGGGGSARIVHKLGGRIILDEPQPINILNALDRAVVISENFRMERTNLANIQTILHYVKEGVICLDSQKNIVFHNNLALRLLHVQKQEDLARYYELLGLEETGGACVQQGDRLFNIKGRDLLASNFPILLPATGTGVVCFLHDVQMIRKIHRRIEKDLHSRGLIASHSLENIKGDSLAVAKLKKSISSYGPTDISVCIHGETGTGKELVAHALHLCSKRAAKPFVGVNCSALPDQLLESELFGYEEGAFTGAKRGGKPGLFELADGGTIFLDEIGDMSSSVQVRLLRVLDSREIMRVGGDRFIAVNVRIVCASHKNLAEMVQCGRFRQDLFFRLAGVYIETPPLRERLEDIPALLGEIFNKYNKSWAAITPCIHKKINNYSWPGNIRELLAVMEAYLVLLGENESDDNCFNEIFRERDKIFDNREAWLSLSAQVAAFRKKIVSQELAKNNGDKKATARKLEISTSSLRRIIEYGNKKL